MAIVTRYVNPASGGGNGTTNGTGSGGTNAYASLSAWEAAEQTAFNSGTDHHVVKCEGSTADTTAVTLAGWTGTSATKTIRIICEAGVGRHDGKYDTGAYRLEVVGTCLHINGIDYVKVEGLQVFINQDADNKSAIIIEDGKFWEIGWCVIKGTPAGSGGYQRGISVTGASGTLGGNGYIHDNTIYDCGTYTSGTTYGGIHMNLGGLTATIYVYNNTVYNCGSGAGINGIAGTCYAKNNVVNVRTSGSAYRDAGSVFAWHANSAKNIDDDGTTPSGKNATVSFVATGSDDYHLASGDTAANTYGDDLSSDGDLDSAHTKSTTDIDNATRTASWSAGSHELDAAAGGLGIPIAMHHYTKNMGVN